MTTSVVIPTHLRPALLAEALASVLDQTEAPSEVVVVDDADQPEARAVVDEAAGAHPATRVLYIASDRPGASASRNVGMRRTSGDLIAFLDDDDLWHPAFLERARAELGADTRAAWVACWIAVEQGGAIVAHRCAARDLRPEDFLLVNPGVIGSNLVLRRGALEGVGGWDETLPNSQDLDLAIRLLRAGHGGGVVEEVLVVHRRLQDVDGISTTRPVTSTGRRLFWEKHRGWPSRPRRFLFRLRTLTNQPRSQLSAAELVGRQLGRVLLRGQKDLVQASMHRRLRRAARARPGVSRG